MVLDQFQHTGATEAFEWFGGRRRFADLRRIEGQAERTLHWPGKRL